MDAVGGGRDLPAAGHRPTAAQSAGPSRFGSESVRRDLRDMSAFRDQERPEAAAANGHVPAPNHEPCASGMVEVSDLATRGAAFGA